MQKTASGKSSVHDNEMFLFVRPFYLASVSVGQGRFSGMGQYTLSCWFLRDWSYKPIGTKEKEIGEPAYRFPCNDVLCLSEKALSTWFYSEWLLPCYSPHIEEDELPSSSGEEESFDRAGPVAGSSLMGTLMEPARMQFSNSMGFDFISGLMYFFIF